MAFGSRTVAEYDVGFNIDLGKVTGQLGAVGETFNRTTGQMSNDAIRLSVAQEKLTRAIARSGPESTAAKTALLNYRRELESLQHTQTAAVAATGRHTSALKQEERELSGASRGALAASGVFRGLGRAVAFSSGTFLGGAGLVFAIKEATKAAADQETAEGQLETALKNRGIAVDGVRGRVDALTASNAKLGFGELDVTKSLTLAVTATGSLEGATRLLSVAQNVARAKGIDLADAARITVQGFEGQSKALRALGVDVTKGAKGFQVLDEVQAKYAGRAVAYANGPAGAYARLNAELERTKVTIGRELLPAELRIADAVSNWLGKTKNQEKIQRDLNAIVKTGGAVVHDFGEAVGFVRTVLGPVNKLLGGTAHSVELVAAALVALKVRAIAADMGILAANTARAGAAAAGAAGEYNALASAEGRAATAGAGVGRGGTGLPLGIPNVGGRTGVVGRINQYTGGAPAPASTGLGLGVLGAIALGGFGGQQDSFSGGQDAYLDDVKQKWKFNNPALGKPAKPGAVFDIGGKKYLVTYKNGAAYLYSREYLLAHQPVNTKLSATQGAGPHGAAAIPAAVAAATAKTAGPAPLSRAQNVAVQVQRASLAVARGDKGAEAQLVAALKKQIDLDRDNEKLQERLVRTDVKNRKAHLSALQSLYADEQSALDQITSIDQANEKATTDKAKKAADAKKKSARARAAAAKKAASELNAEIARLYKGHTSLPTPGRYPGESDAEYASRLRSAGLNKLYGDKIKDAQAADKTTTKNPTLTRADIRAEVSSAIGTLHDILLNESNVSSVNVLKQIRTHLLQSENHLRVIRNGQALSQAEDRSRPLINAHLARQASFA